MVRRINAAGGVKSKNGARIILITADDGSQAARAASEGRRLIVEGRVQLLVGSLQSAQMISLSPVIDELGIPALSVWGGGSQSRNMFSLGYPFDRGTAKNIHDFIVFLRDSGTVPVKTVVLSFSDYEGGQQVNRFLAKRLEESGFEILGEAPLDIRAENHSTAMSKIATLKPHVVAGLVNPRDAILLHKARFEIGYDASLFCSGLGYSDLSFWNGLGDDIAKRVLTRNLYGMTGYSPGARIGAAQSVAAELQSEAKIERVGQGAIQFAQAATVIHQVLETSAGLDGASLVRAFDTFDMPLGDSRLYLAKPDGLQFAEDRLLNDGSAIFVQWTPDRGQQAIFPKQFAETRPNARL